MQTIPLKRVGTQVINSARVPVYALPTGQYVEQTDAATGKKILVSVDGAKALKNGQYPLHQNVEQVAITSVVNDEVPFALRPDATQRQSAQSMLRSLMDRLIDSGTNFRTVEN